MNTLKTEETKRYFAYATDMTAVMVRYHAYFDNLEEAKKYAQAGARQWGGCWAVTDTTLLNSEGQPGKLIESGDYRRGAA